MVGLSSMRTYQLLLVLKPSLKEAERKKVADSVGSWLKDSKIIKQNDLGEKASGYFVEMLLEAGNIPSDINKKIRTADGVLRHLFLRRD